MTTNEFLENKKDWYSKEIKIVCNDGQVIFGKYKGYVSELDNEPDGEAIYIAQTRRPGWEGTPMEIEIEEIESIEVLGI